MKNIIELLDEKCCFINLKVKNQEELLKRISCEFSQKYDNLSAEDIYSALKSREDLGTTGFGNAIALPHAKLKNIEDFSLIITTLKKGIDFHSIDKKKVKVIIGILGPEDKNEEYLRLLARISKILRRKNILDEFLSSASELALKESFIRNFLSFEKNREETQKTKLMVINLTEQKYFYDILNLLVENNIVDVVINESTTLDSHISQSPLFSGFLDFLSYRTGSCKTITAVVETNLVPTLIDEIENLMGDLNTRTGVQIIVSDPLILKGAIFSR